MSVCGLECVECEGSVTRSRIASGGFATGLSRLSWLGDEVYVLVCCVVDVIVSATKSPNGLDGRVGPETRDDVSHFLCPN